MLTRLSDNLVKLENCTCLKKFEQMNYETRLRKYSFALRKLLTQKSEISLND